MESIKVSDRMYSVLYEPGEQVRDKIVELAENATKVYYVPTEGLPTTPVKTRTYKLVRVVKEGYRVRGIYRLQE